MPEGRRSYDSLVYVDHGGSYYWHDQWDWKRIRKLKKTPHERALLDLRVAMYNLGDKFRTGREQSKAISNAQKALLPYELREIDKIHKELVKRELIEPVITKKKEDKWSFDTERKDKNTRKEYIVKRRTIDGKRVKKYVGKSLPDAARKLRDKAYEIVWGDNYMLTGLSPSEIEMHRILNREVARYPYKKYAYKRDPLLQRYIEKLDIKLVKVKGYHVFLSKYMKMEEKKRILDAARKALTKRDRRIIREFTVTSDATAIIPTNEITTLEPKVATVTNKKHIFVHCYA
jgi:hypothetical protein